MLVYVLLNKNKSFPENNIDSVLNIDICPGTAENNSGLVAVRIYYGNKQ